MAGRYAEALEELRRGHELGSRRPGWRYPSERWVRDTERMAALDARLPAVLKGDDHPADAAEALALPRSARSASSTPAPPGSTPKHSRQTPSWPTTAGPGTPTTPPAPPRMAGCGQGQDDPPPDAAARARLRGQALAWLQGELAAWSRTLGDGKPASRTAALRVLTHWKTDPDLAGVRDEAGLARLPEDERQPWRALWADVDTLLKKVQADLP